MKKAYLVPFTLILFTAALAAREMEPHYQTAVLKKDCECKTSYFVLDQLEVVSKPIRLKEERTLGKFCQQNGDAVECRVERPDAAKEGGVICPMSCVSLVPTHPLTDEQQNEVLEKKVVESREAYISKVPKAIVQELKKRFPDWIPAVIRQGDFQKYDPHYSLVNPFVLDRQDGFTLLLFYSDVNSARNQKLSWILADSNTGQIIRSGDGVEAENVNLSHVGSKT